MDNIIQDFSLQLLLILGVLFYMAIIFLALKKGMLAVKYAIIWILSGLALLLFAMVPYSLMVLRDLVSIVDPVHFIFMLVLIFLLFNVLAISIIVSGFTKRITKLIQTTARLEKRVRELEGDDR